MDYLIAPPLGRELGAIINLIYKKTENWRI